MESDLQKLEAQLQAMRPVGLNDALLDRLTGAVAGTLESTDTEYRPVEAATSKLAPVALSDDLMDRLTKVVDQVPFPVDEKVVLFPRGSAAVEVVGGSCCSGGTCRWTFGSNGQSSEGCGESSEFEADSIADRFGSVHASGI